MPIDVNGISSAGSQPGRPVADKQSAAAAPGPSPNGAGAPNDTVELSSLIRAREMADSVRDEPIIDGKRVQATRDAIASGNHQVDAHRVAEKFLAFETALPSLSES